MKETFTILTVMIFIVGAFGARKTEARFSDLVVRGAKIRTMDSRRTRAEAFAVTDGLLVYVGGNSGVESYIGPRTRVVKLAGETILPGFQDSHVHPVSSGIGLTECDLAGAQNENEISARIRKFVERSPTAKWIRGTGWEFPMFSGGKPYKNLLDRLVPDRPAYFVAADGHAVWINTKALELSGIDGTTVAPKGGRIDLDKEGNPTGLLIENATSLVEEHLPAYSIQERLDGLRRALRLAHSFGITSLRDPHVSEGELEAYRLLDGENKLTARVSAGLEVDPKRGVDQLAEMLQLKRKFDGRFIRVDAAKIFLDGVMESHSAALLEPYFGLGSERGALLWEPGNLSDVVSALELSGFQIQVHAIGDRAVRTALDAFQYARRVNKSMGTRHQIAHLQLVDPADIPRFVSLNVVANIQPLWAFPDRNITQFTEPFLGRKRSRWLYPFSSIAKTGASVVCGSDWSVTSLNPFEAIQVAVSRREVKAGQGKAWIPEEVLDIDSAVACYTINGAYATFQEKQTGSIEVGKAADFIVIDRDVFEVPTNEIHETRVLRTFVGGMEV